MREIVRKVIATPALPLLGVTKTFEAIVAGGELVAWVGFTVLASVGYVFADDFSETVEELTD